MQISTCETNDMRDCQSDFSQKATDGDTVHASSPMLSSNIQNHNHVYNYCSFCECLFRNLGLKQSLQARKHWKSVF